MKFKELILKYSWSDIETRLRELYYDLKNKDLFTGEKLNKKEKINRIDNLMEGYSIVFNTLKLKRSMKPKDKKNLTIQITKVEKEIDGSILENPWYSVNGINGSTYLKDDEMFKYEYEKQVKEGKLKDNYKEMANQQISYALEFSSWCVWNGMDVSQESINSFGEVDVICHCLWEMTFFGFREAKIKNFSRTLNKRVETIKNGTAKLVPWEEVKKELKELK